MSDGGGESGRKNENEAKKTVDSGGDDFGRAVTRIAVAQICEGTGFQSFQQSALEALSDIAIRYLLDLGRTVHFCANLAGRTECNVFDIIQGLEDLGSFQGFSGASDVNRCLVSSGTVREISQFVNLAEEIPFARPLPRFPVRRGRKPTPSFSQIGETPPSKHIPDWLPAFPDPHTYIHTPVWNERETDLRTDKLEQARQRRKAEQSLLSLQHRLACNGTALPNSMDISDGGKAKQVVESNSFLAPPLQFWEKDVSPVILPDKLSNEDVLENRISVLKTFAPAIEAAKSGFCDSEDSERKSLPYKRPTVHFRVGIDKKSLATPLAFSAQNLSVENRASWVLRDDERDDKKRRAEQILKEAMGNPHELPQL
ncbi:TBP-associated factor 8 [Tasmannia lanceolata]|uniref:TBP-associated factor 8 n=1 Tax=Tasmannia lanceolata TaxID=3420 RepID=UPI0040640FA1